MCSIMALAYDNLFDAKSEFDLRYNLFEMSTAIWVRHPGNSHVV